MRRLIFQWHNLLLFSGSPTAYCLSTRSYVIVNIISLKWWRNILSVIHARSIFTVSVGSCLFRIATTSLTRNIGFENFIQQTHRLSFACFINDLHNTAGWMCHLFCKWLATWFLEVCLEFVTIRCVSLKIIWLYIISSSIFSVFLICSTMHASAVKCSR